MSEFKPGDLIYRSKPYVYVLNNDVRSKRCDYCFTKHHDLACCSQCNFVYFCDRNCQRKAWKIHKLECKLIKKASPNLPTATLRLVSHIIFMIQKFGLDEPFEVIHGHKMNFRRLMSHSEEVKKNLKACQLMMGLLETLKPYIGESNIPPLHEFIDIFGKMCVNSFSISDGEMQSIGVGVYLGASIFDHSCEPDAEAVFNGTELSIRAVKMIPHADVTRIFISYIEQLQLLQQRQDNLKEQYYFCCQCSRCTSSNYEDLMTKTLVNKNEVGSIESLVTKFKERVSSIKEMKKDKASASAISEACFKELQKQEGILGDTHIFRIRMLELAFDASIQNNQWADAVMIGTQLIDPYKLLYGRYHPNVGIHLFKVGKIQNFQRLTESAKTNLLQAEDILKVTHGVDHPLYKDLVSIISDCKYFTPIEK